MLGAAADAVVSRITSVAVHRLAIEDQVIAPVVGEPKGQVLILAVTDSLHKLTSS